MKKQFIHDFIIVVIVTVCALTINWIVNKNKPVDNSYTKSLEQERNKLLFKIDSLYTEYDKLDSINFEYKKKELIRNNEYQDLKAQYNILKHENKDKNTPIKHFDVAQLDSFWNSVSRTGQN
jgi:hypothetical protein